ncbi:hypothetical protein HHK36_021545 [Tetracentron sinense]|uniref:Tify domain-containing protein n=1 Tax=Tetracentron sinense TaxID=13715 RepID=A0A835DAR8_TETSI|nr:hypothetical protein HHK36_021545 [Tetracentron sinense]
MKLPRKEKLSITIDKDQILSRVKRWKKLYEIVNDLLSQSGFGWNDTRKMVDAEDSVWVEYLKVMRIWRSRSILDYDSIAIIIGDDQASGRGQENIFDGGMDMTNPIIVEELETSFQDLDEGSLFHFRTSGQSSNILKGEGKAGWEVKMVYSRGSASDSLMVVVAGDTRLPQATASVGASSGGLGPVSTTSDLGSDALDDAHDTVEDSDDKRQDIVEDAIEYDIIPGKKAEQFGFCLHGLSRDKMPQMVPDSLENSHLMKQPIGSRPDSFVSKWERSMPMNAGHTVQYPSSLGQFAPFLDNVSSKRYSDANAGPSIISQVAADEGSRTGIKGSGLLSSINASSGSPERNKSRVLPNSSRPKSGTHISDPESTNPPSQHALTSASRQMTVFYAGQAHVFDDVHPNKDTAAPMPKAEEELVFSCRHPN